MKKRKIEDNLSQEKCRIILIPKIKSFQIGNCKIVMAVGNDYRKRAKYCS